MRVRNVLNRHEQSFTVLCLDKSAHCQSIRPVCVSLLLVRSEASLLAQRSVRRHAPHQHAVGMSAQARPDHGRAAMGRIVWREFSRTPYRSEFGRPSAP